jgi:hypothetical protein
VPAVGPGFEIVVLTAPESRQFGERVAAILSEEIQLVQTEPRFRVVEDALDQVSFYDTRKLLFFVSNDEESLKHALRRATGTRTRTSVPGLWIDVEPFAAGQIAFLFTGDVETMSDVVTNRAQEIVDVVEDTAITLLLTNVFRAGEREGARRAMVARWGWGVRVAPQWVVDDKYEADGFVRVWQDGPVEQLAVAWEKGRVVRTPQEWLMRRDELVARFYDGDEVVLDSSTAVVGATPYEIEGTVLSGLWENDKYVIGGPFKSYAFYCPDDDRTYLVDLCVYAPDRPKMPLMRTLEAVARTFRCGCVPRTSEPAS